MIIEAEFGVIIYNMG